MNCSGTDTGSSRRRTGSVFGMDAVLLSGFASVKPGEKVLDLGTGTGIIPILLEAKDGRKPFYRSGDPGGDGGDGIPECGAQQAGR